jgi:hypothetical protein
MKSRSYLFINFLYWRSIFAILALLFISRASFADNAKIVDGELLLKYMPGTGEAAKTNFEKQNKLVILKILPLADIIHYKVEGRDPYFIVEDH